MSEASDDASMNEVAESSTETPVSRRRRWVVLCGIVGAFGAAAVLAFVLFGSDRGLVGGDGSVDGVSLRTGKPYVKVPSDAPLRLDKHGGQVELDRCDGAWTQMEDFNTDGFLPLWAQHDYCGGAQILGWKAGQEVTVDGSKSTWRVTEIRKIAEGSTLEKTRGMKGTLLLQTCLPAPSSDYQVVAIEELG